MSRQILASRWLSYLGVMLGVFVSGQTTTAAILSPASYSVVVQASVRNSLDDQIFSQTPISYSSAGSISTLGTYEVDAVAAGGAVPFARINGKMIPSNTNPGISPLGAAMVSVNYQLQSNTRPGFNPPPNTLIPFIANGTTFAEINGNGFAESSVTMSSSLFEIIEFSSVITQRLPHTHHNAFTRTFVSWPGLPINVNLFARGITVGEWTAAADPIFEIDPTAEFELGGQMVRYADVFEIEFSPGLDAIPEPSTGGLLGCLVAGLSWRPPRRRLRNRC